MRRDYIFYIRSRLQINTMTFDLRAASLNIT